MQKLSIIGQLFSFQTVVVRADYVKQFSGLARIRVTENWEEKCSIHLNTKVAAWEHQAIHLREVTSQVTISFIPSKGLGYYAVIRC